MYVTTQKLDGTVYQVTRSWRTGRRFPGESPREVVSNPPIPTGNLGMDIANRNRYYKTLAANMQSSPGYGSDGHTLTRDGGHEFYTLRLIPSYGTCTTWDRYGNVTMRGPASPFIGVDWSLHPSRHYNPPKLPVMPLGIHPTLGRTNSMGPVFDQQISSSITNMLPDHGEMGWFETLVELARGNLPKAIPDLMHRAAVGLRLDPKGTKRDLGSDYLNARFGIEPIFSDMRKLIEGLQEASGLLYDSFKRQRMTSGVSLPYESRTIYGPRDGGIGYGGNDYISNIVPLNRRFTVHYYTDHSIKAKFSKAQPGVAGERFADQAIIQLRRLGLNEKLAWDLLPFSWLVDWAGNIGSSIENAAAFAPNVGRYLSQYMWVTRKVTVHADCEPFVDYRSHNGRLYKAAEYSGGSTSLVVLDRTPVSPFGVSFKLPSMDAYKWSILVALGLAYKRR